MTPPFDPAARAREIVQGCAHVGRWFRENGSACQSCVAAALTAVRDEERERCAKIADALHAEEVEWMGRTFRTQGEPLAAASAHTAKKIAAAIRHQERA